ncbi:MAG TPA: hypothetical protein V6C96_04350, partial [Vampirovibrionales bacterium]
MQENIVKIFSYVKQSKVSVFISIALALVLMAGVFFYTQTLSQKVLGVQILTSKGTFLVGLDKYSKSLQAWFSPSQGYFEKNKQPFFLEIKNKKDKISNNNWEVEWEWSEVYKSGETKPLLNFKPKQEDLDLAVETLSSWCSSNKDKQPSCQWSISQTAEIASMVKGFVGLIISRNEFYGGAHPIAIKKLTTYSTEDWKPVRFEEIFKTEEAQNELFTNLNLRIQELFDQSNFSFANENNPQIGGMDLFDLKEIQSETGLSDNPRENIEQMLVSQGFSFAPNAFAPALVNAKPGLIFAFPHSEQVNRGLNYKTDLPFDQLNIPDKLNKSFKNYKFSKDSLDNQFSSKDSKWSVTQDINLLEVHVNNKTFSLPKSVEGQDIEVEGVFW